MGVGAVGSHVAPMLAKCGVKHLTLYDGDDVSSHNVPMSLVFGTEDIGKYKTHVMAKAVESLSGIVLKAISRMYAGEQLVGSVVACVDTMDARQLIWKEVHLNPNIDLYVDTRVHEHYVSVFAIRPCEPEDIKTYELSLYSQETTKRRTCGKHGIVYMSAIAASIATRALTGFWSGVIPRRNERILLGTNGMQTFSSTETSDEVDAEEEDEEE